MRSEENEASYVRLSGTARQGLCKCHAKTLRQQAVALPQAKLTKCGKVSV